MHRFGGKDDFLKDWAYEDACVMVLGQIGEEAKTISNWLENNSKYDWGPVIHFRDFIYHNYSKTNYETIWYIISDDVPQVSRELSKLLNKFHPADEFITSKSAKKHWWKRH